MSGILRTALLAMLLICVVATGALADGKATLYADFGDGSEQTGELDLIRTKELEYQGALDVFMLAQGLSEWSGLDFTIASVEPRDNGIAVEWAPDSTLIAGLDDRDQKEDFFFFDVDSLDWFMMDSLWRTIRQNMDHEEVYYMMDGGADLELPNLSGWNLFPADLPYMGSAFFYNHADARGDTDIDE